MHICVGNLTIIRSDNGLLPGRFQAIIWNNAGILLSGPWRTKLSQVKGAVSYRFLQGLLTLMCNNSKLKADINFFFFSVA